METKSLTELLGSTANTELFSGTRFQPAKPIPAAPVEPKQPREKKSQKKAAEGETEEDRMIFVGNVDLACKKNKVKKLLEKYGPVEKVWRRSIPLDRGKLPITAAVALGMYKEGADSCNFYVLFKNAADAKDSVKLNGEEFLAKHLRVNFAYKPVQNRECSIFLGSLPYMIKDEELWEEFKEFGEIEYVRVIRDPITFVGKGIGFICFKEKNAAKRAISKNNTFLQGRTIRVSKARDTELDAEPKKNKFNGFSNLKNLKTQADILDTAKMFTTKGTSSLKGTKKLVRKEQNKLQEKRKQRKESNTKTINQAKKPKKKAKLE